MDVRQVFFAIKLPEQANQGLVNTKSFLNEATHQTINNLSEITNKSLNSVNETAAQANQTFSTLTDEAKQSLTQTVGNTANNVNQITTKTVEAIAEKAKQAEDSWLVTSHKITSSLEDNLQKVEQLSNTLSIEIERSINSLINQQLSNLHNWINEHPVIAWVLKILTWSINHPILSLIAFLLVIFMIWQLFKVFGRLLEQGLLATLSAPFKFFAPLLKFSFKPLTSLKGNSKVTPTFNSYNKQDRLNKLLSRLEAIKQEQDNILQEITAIVSANSNLKKE